jgi:3-phytase
MNFLLYPEIETEPSPYPGDSLDDAVVWYNVENPGQSLVLTTLKASNQRPVLPTGILTYDLQGNQQQFLKGGTPNNIDLRSGFPSGDQKKSLIAASHWYTGKVGLYQLDDTLMLKEHKLFDTGVDKLHGLCMGKLNDQFFYFAIGGTGTIERYRIVDLNEVILEGRWQLESESEGCVVDEVGNRVYIAEENRGIWYLPLNPSDNTQPTLLDHVRFFGPLTEGIEGLAILKDGEQRYLVASVQEKSRFAVYNLKTNLYVASFRINPKGSIDGVTKTDGVEIMNRPLGAQFPEGLMVVHDDENEPQSNQSFKYVSRGYLLDAIREAAN